MYKSKLRYLMADKKINKITDLMSATGVSRPPLDKWFLPMSSSRSNRIYSRWRIIRELIYSREHPRRKLIGSQFVIFKF